MVNMQDLLDDMAGFYTGGLGQGKLRKEMWAVRGNVNSCRNKLKTETASNVSCTGASITVRGIIGTVGFVIFPDSEKVFSVNCSTLCYSH